MEEANINPANSLSYDDVSAKLIVSLARGDSFDRAKLIFPKAVDIIWNTQDNGLQQVLRLAAYYMRRVGFKTKLTNAIPTIELHDEKLSEICREFVYAVLANAEGYTPTRKDCERGTQASYIYLNCEDLRRALKTDKALACVTIHEYTHFALDIIYDHNGVPFPAPGVEKNPEKSTTKAFKDMFAECKPQSFGREVGGAWEIWLNTTFGKDASSPSFKHRKPFQKILNDWTTYTQQMLNDTQTMVEMLPYMMEIKLHLTLLEKDGVELKPSSGPWAVVDQYLSNVLLVDFKAPPLTNLL